MSRPPLDRGDLARPGGGVAWCHTTNWTPVEALLQAGRAGELPGVICVTATNGARRPELYLASDISAALGVNPTAEGRPRADTEIVELVPMLATREVTDLLIGSAWWTPFEVLAMLADAARAAGVRLWLIGTDPLPAADEVKLDLLATRVTDKELLAAFSDKSVTGASPFEPAGWPAELIVPTSDFATFLADTRAQLSPKRAKLVETVLRAEHDRAGAWWTTNHADVDVDALAAAIAARWGDCVSWSEFLTRVRAWQIASFEAGYLVKVSPSHLAATASANPGASQRSPEAWNRLHGWRLPSSAAACALVAAGMGSQEVADVTIEAVAKDGSTVMRADGSIVQIEAPARQYLRAALLARHLEGSAPTDHLVATSMSRLQRYRWVSAQASRAREVHGLALPTGPVSRGAKDRWATRWGISLQELS